MSTLNYRRLLSIAIVAVLGSSITWMYTTGNSRRTTAINNRKENFNIATIQQVDWTRHLPAGCHINHFGYFPNKQSGKKIVFHLGDDEQELAGKFQFNGCKYANCVFEYCHDLEFQYWLLADALLFTHTASSIKPHLNINTPAQVRGRQLWFYYSAESPAYTHNHWDASVNSFNGSITYLNDSTPIKLPYGSLVRRDQSVNQSFPENYANNRRKGAYAYVSNCGSQNYNRLSVMKRLSKYINVDIFGSCTNKLPCPGKGDITCEKEAHSQYRFYLSFENSLCKEYITEKFWKVLESDAYFIPVALGGLSVAEYDAVAPPNSFIHLYNFSSIENLGKYLQYLMEDDAAFNSYHEWRKYYTVTRLALKSAACDLCEAVNHPEQLTAAASRLFADEWNNPKNCDASQYKRLLNSWYDSAYFFLRDVFGALF